MRTDSRVSNIKYANIRYMAWFDEKSINVLRDISSLHKDSNKSNPWKFLFLKSAVKNAKYIFINIWFVMDVVLRFYMDSMLIFGYV